MDADQKLCLNGLLEQVKSYQRPIPIDTLQTLLTSMKTDERLMHQWIHFDECIYSRNRVFSSPSIEILIMCWRSGQMTPIHDHNGSVCVVKILKGTATEITYQKSNCGTLIPCSANKIDTNKVICSVDNDMHQMANFESIGNDLVTLHCYSPPLSQKLFNADHTFFHGYQQLLDQVSENIKKTCTPKN